MKKRFLAITLALALCLGLAVPAFAADGPLAFTVTLSGPGSEIPKETREFALRNFTEEYVDNNRLSAIYTTFTRNEETELVNIEGITTLALGTEVTVDGLRTEDRAGGVWDVVGLCAWSDPDGDGIYDQRLFTGFWSRFLWTENNFAVLAASNSGPFSYRKVDYNGHMPIYGRSLNVCGHDSLTHLWRSVEVENMAFPSSVTLSAEYLTRLFGPNTLIRFEVSTYGADQVDPSKASETSSFYGYIPEGQTVPAPPVIEVEDIPASGTAKANTQTVSVDGKNVEFQMYALLDANENQTNYIKLRDLAQILSGTKAQFEVGWNGAVNLETGKPYTSNGSEMSTPFSGDRAYTGGGQKVNINGYPVEMTAIILRDDAGGGYTYFKLRDLGQALGFNVGWSFEQGVYVETDKPYSGA